jgi:SAM-dependent methyltransferase
VLRVKLRARFADVAGLRVLGVGFAAPFLGVFRDEAERVFAFMPAAQGVMDWQSGRGAAAALVEEDMWPLPDSAVDRVVLVHALESADDPREVLRECWRCLEPGGRLLAVVPNRRGAWARLETTPFGHGRPYSRGQLTDLLRHAQFAPVGWSEALMFPPVGKGMVLRSAIWLERMGATFWGPFAGVHIVEAVKQVYTPVKAKRKAARARRVEVKEPVLVPGGAVNTRVSPVSAETPPGRRTGSRTTTGR